MAIVTYVTNLYKPKDVDRRIALEVPGHPLRVILEILLKYVPRSFLDFLWYPSTRELFYKDPRVYNDTFRIRGPVPLISTLTAVPTKVFGGLHCIA